MIDVRTSKDIYRNLYKKFIEEQEVDDNIRNVHSIDLNKVKDNDLNVVFDYGAIRVQIRITDTPEIIITAPDDVKNYIKSVIVEEYSEYIKLIK